MLLLPPPVHILRTSGAHVDHSVLPALDTSNKLLLLQICVRGSGPDGIDLDGHHGLSREDLRALKFAGGRFGNSRLWHMDISHSSTPPEARVQTDRRRL